MICVTDIAAAAVSLRSVLSQTPCRRSQSFSSWFGADTWLKLENLHLTGSFKERGAFWRMSAMSPEERARGVVTASAGNHAQAVAYHARRLGIHAKVLMPERTPLIKMLNTQELGAEVILYGDGFDEAYDRALEIADEEQRIFVSAFDDDRIIAGQGTIGLEIVEQVPDVATVIVPVGGGGLISGIATAIKATRPETRVIGVEPESYPAMSESVAAGRPVAVPGAPTIADGIALKRVTQRTLDHVQHYVDGLVQVDEESIARAVLVLLERSKTLAEGAGAAALAAVLEGKVDPQGKPVVLVVSGGNIDSSRLDDIIVRGLAADGRRVRLRVVMPDVPGQLHKLTGIIADHGVNVLEVRHDRAFGRAAIGQTAATCELETRGQEQVRELLAALSEAGFEQVERVQPSQTSGPVRMPTY